MPGGRGIGSFRRLQSDRALGLKRILNGGTEIEYFGTICAGDVLTSTSHTAAFEETKGSLGEMLITTSKTEYTRKSDGKLVAVMTGTGIRY